MSKQRFFRIPRIFPFHVNSLPISRRSIVFNYVQIKEQSEDKQPEKNPLEWHSLSDLTRKKYHKINSRKIRCYIAFVAYTILSFISYQYIYNQESQWQISVTHAT